MTRNSAPSLLSSSSPSSSSLEYLNLSCIKSQGSVPSDSVEKSTKLQYPLLQENEITRNALASSFDLKHPQPLILYGDRFTDAISRPIKILKYLARADFICDKLSGRFNR